MLEYASPAQKQCHICFTYQVGDCTKQSQKKPYNIVYAWKWAEYQKEMTKPFPLHLDPLDDHIPENEMI